MSASDVAPPLFYPLDILDHFGLLFIYLFIFHFYLFQGQDRGYWSKHAPELVQYVILVCNNGHVHELNRPAFPSCHIQASAPKPLICKWFHSHAKKTSFSEQRFCCLSLVLKVAYTCSLSEFEFVGIIIFEIHSFSTFHFSLLIHVLCSSRKYPYSPHRRDWNFLGGGGFCKAKKFEEMYEA